MFSFYLAHEYWFAAAQLSLAMLGMGATLTPKDFKGIVETPRAFTVGMCLQLLLVPLVAFLFIAFSGAAIGVLIGLALLAAIPGGTVSNIFTYMAKGNIVLSIAITAITTIGCLVTTPIVLNLLISQHMPADFVMPVGRIAFEICIFLLIPLAFGMAINAKLSNYAAKISKFGIYCSIFIILLIVIGSAGAGRLDLSSFGTSNILTILVFALALLTLSVIVPKILRLPTQDGAAIQIEITVRNTNLGLLLNASLFPVGNALGGTVLMTLLLYGAVMLLLGGGLITYNRNIHKTV
ncbi:bile acid:sodium symporter family protein [Hellea balneolensis]|uniref:bile acid:sodium symporter family protein n=1 Tax=Hellea balneolensis TaxID=287478 RepID=UPI00040C4B46|nr:bile acid:sodium symporter [Hellea balneolensis]